MPAAKPFRDAVREYAENVRQDYAQHLDAQPEDQLKHHVGDLVISAGSSLPRDIRWRSETRADDVQGRPDLGITVGGLLTGHIELKKPGLGARAERFSGSNRDQFKRFSALPNLIYTDGSEWSLYRTGELQQRVRIAPDVSETGNGDLDDEAINDLGRMLSDFLHWEPIPPSSARDLARLLAPLSRILRDEVGKAAAKKNSVLEQLADEWRGLLFPEADDAQFADAYAQTVTYALLLAQFEETEDLDVDAAVGTLQSRHSLLAQALRLLGDPQVREEVGMPIELLERAIRSVDSEKIGRRGDPWLYFYEDFLAEYDAALRKARGVYYTPVEVVQAQVRLIEDLLTSPDYFGKSKGYADDEVVVLDPATGTGTYPLAVIDRAVESVEDRLGAGAVPGEITDLAKRVYGFELLVGPYAVAHLRLAQRYRSAGARMPDDGPLVYLTDTLESPEIEAQRAPSILSRRLNLEHQRAQKVKRDVPVLVCLGNPPYDREQRDPAQDDQGRRKGGWVRYGDPAPGDEQPRIILEDFLKPARDVGAGVHLKNLYNDYVYFWRWALWKVFGDASSPEIGGIVSFITASSYLRGPGFVGMRRVMRETFDELWIIDLEGDSLGARKTENVFDIRTPVAIAVGVRTGTPDPSTPARVWKTKLTGTREAKLLQLSEVWTRDDLEWRECSREWGAPFYPLEQSDYGNSPRVTDMFPWQHSGVQMKRTWPIAESTKSLVQRWRTLVSAPGHQRPRLYRETDRRVTSEFRSLENPNVRDEPVARLSMDSPMPPVQNYGWRSFDRHYVLCDARLGDRIRPELWRPYGSSQIHMTSLLTKALGLGPGAVATHAVPDMDHFSGRGAKDIIPLWRDAAATEPNVTQGLLETISSSIGRDVSPEDLFAYCYGILNQRGYVKTFWEELELPGPRVPITRDPDLFFRVVEIGSKLIHLHTYGERFMSKGKSPGVPRGTARNTVAVPTDRLPEDFEYIRAEKALRVGEGRFEPVEPEVWDYSVSGLQVVRSWLSYRKANRAGRKSSPLDDIRPEGWELTEELLELLWVLEHTIALEPEARRLFEQVLESDLFTEDELPKPTDDQRKPPVVDPDAEMEQSRFSI